MQVVREVNCLPESLADAATRAGGPPDDYQERADVVAAMIGHALQNACCQASRTPPAASSEGLFFANKHSIAT